MAETLNVSLYLDPQYFELNGVCNASGCDTSVGYEDQDDGALIVKIPMEAVGENANVQNIAIAMVENGEDPFDCLFCADTCRAENEDRPPYFTALPAMTGVANLSRCAGRISWRENYRTINLIFGSQRKESVLTFTTNWDMPELCGIKGYRIEFEISDFCNYTEYFGHIDEIPADNALARTYSKTIEKQWDFTEHDTCFYPGESMIVYALVDTLTQKDYKIPIAIGWYETKCLTSGIIIGCGLLDTVQRSVSNEQIAVTAINTPLPLLRQHITNARVKDYRGVSLAAWGDDENGTQTRAYSVDLTNGAVTISEKADIHIGDILQVDYTWIEDIVLEGGEGSEYSDAWTGDERLHWLVNFKGLNTWLKCSDFAKYAIGDRVLIYKNGANSGMNWRKCRNSDGTNAASGEDILCDSCVVYTLDKSADVILPYEVA
ncbi:hypothetical protein MCHI_002787 [Candidatus Magnetoovum chiemensis]|nr:hypothetical protein MCHI_002787 [Candidatus Magnetoovum chiemensis]